MASTPVGILSFHDARHTVEKHASSIQPGTQESVNLLEAGGRVLAESLYADRDFPPFPRSTRDGYAVHSKDLANLPAQVRLVAEIKAGASLSESNVEIHPGEAARIMTGAPVPKGADAVVMVEYTEDDHGTVHVTRSVTPGENVVPTGSEARQGALLLEKGTLLSEAGIGIAASIGKTRLQVYSRSTIAVLATGDEICRRPPAASAEPDSEFKFLLARSADPGRRCHACGFAGCSGRAASIARSDRRRPSVGPVVVGWRRFHGQV